MNINTENAVIYEISYEGSTAMYWTVNDLTYFVWRKQNLLCSISAPLPIEEILKIAENINFK